MRAMAASSQARGSRANSSLIESGDAVRPPSISAGCKFADVDVGCEVGGAGMAQSFTRLPFKELAGKVVDKGADHDVVSDLRIEPLEDFSVARHQLNRGRLKRKVTLLRHYRRPQVQRQSRSWPSPSAGGQSKS